MTGTPPASAHPPEDRHRAADHEILRRVVVLLPGRCHGREGVRRALPRLRQPLTLQELGEGSGAFRLRVVPHVSYLHGVVGQEEADDELLLVGLAQGREGSLRVSEVSEHLPVVVEELVEAVVGVLGAVFLPLALGPHALPALLVGVGCGGLDGGQLHTLGGQVGPGEVVTAVGRMKERGEAGLGTWSG